MLGHKPVINPLSLVFTSFLLSNVSRNLSRPWTSNELAPNMKMRDMDPTKAITILEPSRHGRLGSTGKDVDEWEEASGSIRLI